MIPLRDSIPSSRTPLIAWAVIAANAFVFYLQLTAEADAPVLVRVAGRLLPLASGFEQVVWRFGLRPVELLGHHSLPPHTGWSEWVTPLTSMFMHGGWMHFLGNMLYVWIFADNVEDAMGHVRFVVFYLLAGLAAAAAQIAASPSSSIPMVGASGAIAGVLGGYLVLYPHARVLTLVPIFFYVRMVEIPAFFLLGFWILLQVLQASAASLETGGTAWFAHIGGFVFGMVAIKFFALPRRARW